MHHPLLCLSAVFLAITKIRLHPCTAVPGMLCFQAHLSTSVRNSSGPRHALPCTRPFCWVWYCGCSGSHPAAAAETLVVVYLLQVVAVLTHPSRTIQLTGVSKLTWQPAQSVILPSASDERVHLGSDDSTVGLYGVWVLHKLLLPRKNESLQEVYGLQSCRSSEASLVSTALTPSWHVPVCAAAAAELGLCLCGSIWHAKAVLAPTTSE